jgi:hypothetical protein
MVPKPDGTWRPCGDFRWLNKVTEDNRYPLPHVQDFNQHLDGCNVFSKLDLVSGYHQVPMAAADIPKTAIITPFGLREFVRMPFGLKKRRPSLQAPHGGRAQGPPVRLRLPRRHLDRIERAG